MEIWEGGYEGGRFCHCYTMCHRESVRDCKEGLEEGKEAETSARLWQYHRKQYLGKHNVFRTALVCRALVLPIIHARHRGLGTQQHGVAKVGFFRYRGILSRLEATVGAE